MAKLIVTPALDKTIRQLSSKPVHGLLLHGEVGVGLKTIAEHIAVGDTQVIEPHTPKGEVDHENGVISVETIRALYEQTRGRGKDRYVIIDDAERMTTAAQNALLKLLEEPPDSLHFVLTTHYPQRLLATIRSRAISCAVPRISPRASQTLLDRLGVAESLRAQVLFLGNGRPATLIRLVQDKQLFEKESQRMKDARLFLSATSTYERARVALNYASTPKKAAQLVGSSLMIVEHTLKTTPTSASATTAQRLIGVERAIASNANPRLQLMSFVVK